MLFIALLFLEDGFMLRFYDMEQESVVVLLQHVVVLHYSTSNNRASSLTTCCNLGFFFFSSVWTWGKFWNRYSSLWLQCSLVFLLNLNIIWVIVSVKSRASLSREKKNHFGWEKKKRYSCGKFVLLRERERFNKFFFLQKHCLHHSCWTHRQDHRPFYRHAEAAWGECY